MELPSSDPPATHPGRPWTTIIPFILGSVSIIAWLVIRIMSRHYAAQLQPVPSRLMAAALMYGLLSLLILLLIVIFLFFPPRNWVKYALLLPMCAGILALMGISPVFVEQRDKIWSATFHRVIRHSQPLVAAITDYQHDHGTPPPNLEALVPKYLAAVPDTGITAFPAYHYKVDGNAWSLSIGCPFGMIDFSYYRYCASPKDLKTELESTELKEQAGNWVYIRD